MFGIKRPSNLGPQHRETAIKEAAERKRTHDMVAKLGAMLVRQCLAHGVDITKGQADAIAANFAQAGVTFKEGSHD
jgi:hypothetical protein